MFQDLKKQLEENPKLKQKLIKASMLFGAFIVVIIILFAVILQNKKPIHNEVGNNISGSHLPGDTTSVVSSNKNLIYEEMNSSNAEAKNSDMVIADGASGGAISDQNEEKSNSNDLDAYMRAREASINRMQNNPSKPTSSRRSYNPNGNSDDWTSINTNRKVSGNNTISTNDIDEYEKQSNSRQYSNGNNPSGVSVSNKNPFEGKQISAYLSTSGYIVDGGMLNIVLNDPAVIAGHEVKKGQAIRGTVREENGRLMVDVRVIKIDKKLYPVNNVKIFSEDGIEGIYLSKRKE